MRKILVPLLTLLLLLCLTVSAESQDSDFVFELLPNGTLTLCAYTGNEPDVTVPGYVDGRAVTVIGEDAFCCNWSIVSITLPDTVIEIGNTAFRECPELIRTNIPDSVQVIGDNPWEWCTSLDAIDISAEHPSFRVVDGILYDREGTILIRVPCGLQSDCVTVPDGVQVIGVDAFEDCTGIRSVVLPDSVTEIRYGAFSWCESLSSISLSGNLKSIGAWAFCMCESLSSIDLPDSLTEISDSAFSHCSSIEEIMIPASTVTIGSNPFIYMESLSSITVAESNPVLRMISGALYNTDTHTLICFPSYLARKDFEIAPDTLVIGTDACKDTDLPEKIILPDTVIRIGDDAFHFASSLKCVVVPASVTDIGESSFDTLSEKFSLEGYAGTEAERYARNNGIPFTLITK